jgi:hypothetical protein
MGAGRVPDDAPLWAVLSGGAAVAGLAAARFCPGVAGVLPVCPFRALTGLPCPTCGATRALLALAAGEPGRALAQSPLAVAALALALVAGLWGLSRWLAPSLVPAFRLGPEGQTRLARAGAVLLLLNWAYLLAASSAG